MNFNIDTDHNETEFDDLKQYQEITDVNTIIDVMGVPVILNRYKSDTSIRWLFEHTVDVAALCWGNLDERGNKLQRTLIQFKKDVDDDVTYQLPLNRFMMSLAFLRPIITHIDDLELLDFLVVDALTDKMRKKLQDNIVKTLRSYGYTSREIMDKMADYTLDMKNLVIVFAQADMEVLTAENLFLDHYRESELIREINNTYYPPDMQTAEIVEENARRYKLLEEEMMRRGNPYFLNNKYINIIKPKQMEELYINFSQIPDGKNIVPVIMNGNGFNAGYHEIPVMYAGAIAARVPDTMNEEHMGTAGYFNRNMMMLTYGTISKTVFDCGSRNPIPVVVDEVELDMKAGRYYYESRDSGVLKILKETDTHLLGKTIWIRTPCTCNLNGDVCHVCYGTRALKIGGLKGGFVYTTEAMTSRVQQNILSAKHLLKTSAKKVEYSESFDEFFLLESSEIIPNDAKKFNIYIPENYQDNISNNLTIYVGKDMTPITISNYASIHIPDEIMDECKDFTLDDVTYHKITSHKVLELGGRFAIVTPINIAMTQRYMDIMMLFESEISKFDKIEDAVAYLTKLLYKTIPILSTHGEICIAGLIRQVDNKLLKPDWKQIDPPYEIVRLKTALQNSESVTMALAFEQTRHHLLHSIFDERNKIKRMGPHSFVDFLFGEETL